MQPVFYLQKFAKKFTRKFHTLKLIVIFNYTNKTTLLNKQHYLTNNIMAKINCIFKASELINRFPELGSNIVAEDYIHVAMTNDYMNNRLFLFSYIWDTREIVMASTINEGFDMDPIVKAMRYNKDESLLAEDNLQQIKTKCNLNVPGTDFMNEVDWLNAVVFTARTKIKLIAKSKAFNADCPERILDVLYTIDDIAIVATEVVMTNGKKQRMTVWLRSQLNRVFGWHDNSWYASKGFNNEDRALSAREIQSKLIAAFNVKF